MFDINTVKRIGIGRVGENMVNDIVFDISSWINQLPDAVFSLRYIRPTQRTVYQPQINISIQGGTLTWLVSGTDTAIEGVGLCEVRAENAAGALKKSVTILCVVSQCMTWDGQQDPEAPDPLRGWADRLMRYESGVQQAIESAYSSAQTIIDMANQLIEDSRIRTVEDPERDGWVKVYGGIDVSAVSQPIGSYWITDAPIDPGSLFGGAWEEVTDRVLLGSGKRQAFVQGGAESFMINMGQLPKEVQK